MKQRIEWAWKSALGCICYWVMIALPDKPDLSLTSGKVGGWVLSWAGFYAYDNGYKHWQERTSYKRGK